MPRLSSSGPRGGSGPRGASAGVGAFGSVAFGAVTVGAVALAASFFGRGGVAAHGAGGPEKAERRLTIFYTAETHGTLEPCGCTSDPLGDVARYAEVVRAAGRDVLLVDAGGLSFPEGGASPRERAGNGLRAAFLADALGKLGLGAVGLADTDLAAGAAAVRPARLAVNLAPAPRGGLGPGPSLVKTVGGVKVGVIGVVDPALAGALAAKVDEPVSAARREVERLRKAGVELVVALAPVDRAVARRLAREAGADFVVLGRQVGRGSPRADAVGRGFLVAPADELQRVGRLDVVLRGAGDSLVDAGGPEATALRKDELEHALERVDGELAGWSKPAANAAVDPAFVASKRRARDALAAERARLVATPWSAPATGSSSRTSSSPCAAACRATPPSRAPCASSTPRSAR
jgi:2',3'-cyclic-nucleotide 2'-phosphodiesterase (5'-nucleotidase family)